VTGIEDPIVSARFCPECGSTVGASAKFCGNCGQALPAHSEVHPPQFVSSPDSADAPRPRRRGRAALIALALIGLALAAAAGVIVASGVLSGEDSAADLRSKTKGPFDSAMRNRDQLFQLERTYLTAYGRAQEKIADYRRKDREVRDETKRIEEEFADEFDACLRFAAVSCPNPTYPDPVVVPSFSKETKEIRQVATDLSDLDAELRTEVANAELRAFHAQLLAAVEALTDEAEHNADVLDEAVKPPENEDDTGSLDRGKIRTLREDAALPAMRQMNRQALEVIRDLDVDRSVYDVPGGRDLDPQDHSSAT
jgi:hypothetical protein